ncbi:unnamed protein product, partial [Ectocarpus sp. 12 AP-2014]
WVRLPVLPSFGTAGRKEKAPSRRPCRCPGTGHPEERQAAKLRRRSEGDRRTRERGGSRGCANEQE